MKTKYNYIFVILVYRNISDLEECIKSILQKIKSVKIIVVNAFYDNDSELNCRNIAELYNCDFISIPNKGYSYGNNRGIEVAMDKYSFEYLIIANPDTEILQFDEQFLLNNPKYEITAPKVITLRGKLQNPMCIKENRIPEYLEYKGFKNQSKLIFVIGLVISKIYRKFVEFFFKLKGKKIYPIFTAHGCFVIFSKKAIESLFPVYDEKVFLFAEEGILAKRAQKLGIKTFYNENIHIKHKEDGSMKLSNLSISNILSSSNIYFYENYIKK